MEIFTNLSYSLYPKDSSNISLTNLFFYRKTAYDLIVNPIYYVARSNLGYLQNIDLPFWYDQKILIGINPFEELIFKVLLNDPYGLFKKGFIYYFRNFAIYETLQNAIDEVNEIETTEQQAVNILIGSPNKTYRPNRFKHYANNYHIYSSPQPYAFDYGPFPDTCTIQTGGYTIACKYNPYNSETTFNGSFDYYYTYTDANNVVITTVNNLPVNIFIAVPNNLGETGGATDTVVTISIDHIGIGASVSKTITEPHADFPLTDTVVPTIDGHDLPSPGYDYLNNYFLDLNEITYTFSGEIIFPQELRVNLPDAYFTGEGGDVLGENIDEILTLDLESGCYVSDIKNYYNIPGRLLIETAIWGPSGTGFKFFIGPINYHGYSINRLNVGKRFYDNIYYDWNPQIKQNENILQNKYTAIISTGNTDPVSETNSFTDFGFNINSTAVEKNGYIAPRFKYYVDTLNENASEHYIGQGFRDGFDWSGGVHNVSYAIFNSCRKVYGELYDYENTPQNYYPPWHPNQNFFKNPRFFLASIHENAFISSVRIGAAPAAPTITINTNSIQQNAATLIIAGTGFNLEPLDNIVTFNLGAEGTVTAATANQLTVTFTTQPTSLGSLTASVLSPLNSGAAVQVATVVTSITVTENLDSRAINATTLTIAGTGFNTTAANNSVAFNLGAVGAVTSATSTQLVVTFSVQPTSAGNLTAIVTTPNGNSGDAVIVASIYLNTLTVIVDGTENYNYVLIENSNFNGKNFWIAPLIDSGMAYETWSTIYWTGAEWLISGQYGSAGNDYATNSLNEAIPPTSGWTAIAPYTAVSVAYAVIDLPTWTVAGYACVTGNSGYNNPTFNGLYYRLEGSPNYLKLQANQQINNYAGNIYVFNMNTLWYYESTNQGIESFYDRRTTNDQPPGYFDPNNINDGNPAPTVTLGEC